MYVTRPFSTLSIHPPDAMTDEDAEAHYASCWGLCKRRRVLKLPSPQDKILTIVYTSEFQEATKFKVWFVPALEQWWEEIHSCGKVNHEGNVVNVSVDVQREVALVSPCKHMNGRTGFTWFKAHNPYSKKVVSVGLSSAIVENMRWVLEAGGWISGGDEMDARVEKAGWRKFGCYVLVGSFPLRRMDGSLVGRSDFRHTDKIRCKREYGFNLDFMSMHEKSVDHRMYSLYCSSEGCKFPTPRN